MKLSFDLVKSDIITTSNLRKAAAAEYSAPVVETMAGFIAARDAGAEYCCSCCS